VVEVGLYRCQGLHDLPEASFFLIRQVDASQAKVTQGVGHDISLCFAGVRRQSDVDPGVGLLQAGVLR
jgi:hypothetical protein